MDKILENSLIKKAQMGDEKALDELFENYKHFVVSLARKYYLIGAEQDDLVQEGMLGFFKAITTFNQAKNDFLPYAKTLITHQIINAVKKSNNAKTSFLNESMALNNQGEVLSEVSEKVFSVPNVKWMPENEFLHDEEYGALLKQIKGLLSDYENEIFELYLQGFDYNDIIKKLNTTYKSVDNALSRIKNKLKFLKEEE